MRKLPQPALCVLVSLHVLLAPLAPVAKAEVQSTGLITGVASVDGKPLPSVTVRLRNIDNGQLVGQTTASAEGQFSFLGLNPANYVVEMVAANGIILGTSVAIALTATVMAATNVTVGASAAALAAAGGTGAAAGAGAAIGAGAAAGGTAAAGTGAVAGGVAAGAAAGAAGLSATVVAVSAVGVTLGTTAVVAVANDASPSR